jgi:hypothetical protein
MIGLIKQRDKTMNTAVIAQHLNISETAIVRVEEWANVLFVVCRKLGARFVSKRVVKVTMSLVKVDTILEPVVIDTNNLVGYIINGAMGRYSVKKFLAIGVDVRFLDFARCVGAKFTNILPGSEEFQKVIEAHTSWNSPKLEAFGGKCLYPKGYKLEQRLERRNETPALAVAVAPQGSPIVPDESIPKTLEEARLVARSRFHSWNEAARQLVQEILSANREVCISSHVDPIGLKVQQLGNDLDDTRIKPAIAKIAVALGGKVANYDPN